MLKIDICCVGNMKESYYKQACAEYEKRLGVYCKVGIYEVKDEPLKEQASRAEKEAVLEKEAARLRKYIDEKAFRIALAIEG